MTLCPSAQKWKLKAQELQGKLKACQWAESALRKNEKMYRLLVENANDAIFVVQDGVIRFANPSTQAIFKYSPEQLTAIPVTDIVHPQEREKFVRNSRCPLTSGNRSQTFSCRMIDCNGKDLLDQSQCGSHRVGGVCGQLEFGPQRHPPKTAGGPTGAGRQNGGVGDPGGWGGAPKSTTPST